jgi:hypothetical protein
MVTDTATMTHYSRFSIARTVAFNNLSYSLSTLSLLLLGSL